MKTLLSLALLFASGAAFAAGGEGGHGGDHPIPWMPIGLHALNLAILVGVLAKFAWPMVRDSLKNRAASIKKDIDEANAARKAAEEAYAAVTARLAGLEAEIGRMTQQAEADAQRERERLLAKAADEAAQIKANAERQIADQVARARQSLREEAARLAVDLARTQIQGAIGPADHERLGASFLTTVNAQREGGLHG
jgi:F-type H+-transporting ATPase subunit b